MNETHLNTHDQDDEKDVAVSDKPIQGDSMPKGSNTPTIPNSIDFGGSEDEGDLPKVFIPPNVISEPFTAQAPSHQAKGQSTASQKHRAAAEERKAADEESISGMVPVYPLPKSPFWAKKLSDLHSALSSKAQFRVTVSGYRLLILVFVLVMVVRWIGSWYYEQAVNAEIIDKTLKALNLVR